MPIGQKEWFADHEGHKIRVVNTWFGGAKLYIDGECRDTTRAFIALGETLLSARLNEAGDIVEVSISAILTTKAKISVNKTQIGGDHF
tara:strand:- start:467 stop:730 length:264 start_codon:yes stop_codon:yes gene_type:complete